MLPQHTHEISVQRANNPVQKDGPKLNKRHTNERHEMCCSANRQLTYLDNRMPRNISIRVCLQWKGSCGGAGTRACGVLLLDLADVTLRNLNGGGPRTYM
jgi:hypothetical protein